MSDIIAVSLAVSLAISLLLTLALEAGFFFLVGKRHKKDLLLLVLVNILTNPLVVLTFLLLELYTQWSSYLVLIPLELFAVLTEGHFYKRYGADFRRPFLFSLAANAFSFLTGFLFQQFW